MILPQKVVIDYGANLSLATTRLTAEKIISKSTSRLTETKF